jgi:hypothetical protein
VFALSACGTNVTAPLSANPVHDVLISVTIPGQCIVGGCDPPGGGRTNLALVTVTNTGSTTAYLQACGQQSAMAEQQLINGAWVNVGPAITCPVTPGPIALAAGQSIHSNWFFATGRRRMVVGVGGLPSLADAALDTSASFDVP